MEDMISSYNTGLVLLLEKLDLDEPSHAEVLTLQARLEENVTQTRQYGDTETRRAERAQIMSALNHVALTRTGMSFNEWCGQSGDEKLELTPKNWTTS